MALVKSLGKGLLSQNVLSNFIKALPVSQTSVKSMAYWNKDWGPAPYPKNEKERQAAAKKYGLLPEDYEPLPESEGYGDYPKLPTVSVDRRDPNYLWDIPHLRRDFGEPMHVDADVLTADRGCPDVPLPYSKSTMLLCFFGVVGTLILLFEFSPGRDRVRLMKPRQLYSPGVMHYTFQLEGQEEEESHHH